MVDNELCLQWLLTVVFTQVGSAVPRGLSRKRVHLVFKRSYRFNFLLDPFSANLYKPIHT